MAATFFIIATGANGLTEPGAARNICLCEIQELDKSEMMEAGPRRAARETKMMVWNEDVESKPFFIEGDNVKVPVKPHEIKTIQVSFP